MINRFAAGAAFVAAAVTLSAAPAQALSVGSAFVNVNVSLVSDLPDDVIVTFDASVFDEFTVPFGGNEVLTTNASFDSDDVDGFLSLGGEASASTDTTGIGGGGASAVQLDGLVTAINGSASEVVLEFFVELEFGATASVTHPDLELAGANFFFESIGFDNDFLEERGVTAAPNEAIGPSTNGSSAFLTLPVDSFVDVQFIADVAAEAFSDPKPDEAVIPVPAALPLLATGLGVFAAMRRRRRTG